MKGVLKGLRAIQRQGMDLIIGQNSQLLAFSQIQKICQSILFLSPCESGVEHILESNMLYFGLVPRRYLGFSEANGSVRSSPSQ